MRDFDARGRPRHSLGVWAVGNAQLRGAWGPGRNQRVRSVGRDRGEPEAPPTGEMADGNAGSAVPEHSEFSRKAEHCF